MPNIWGHQTTFVWKKGKSHSDKNRPIFVSGSMFMALPQSAKQFSSAPWGAKSWPRNRLMIASAFVVSLFQQQSPRSLSRPSTMHKRATVICSVTTMALLGLVLSIMMISVLQCHFRNSTGPKKHSHHLQSQKCHTRRHKDLQDTTFLSDAASSCQSAIWDISPKRQEQKNIRPDVLGIWFSSKASGLEPFVDNKTPNVMFAFWTSLTSVIPTQRFYECSQFSQSKNKCLRLSKKPESCRKDKSNALWLILWFTTLLLCFFVPNLLHSKTLDFNFNLKHT